jgi:hypothetical protein
VTRSPLRRIICHRRVAVINSLQGRGDSIMNIRDAGKTDSQKCGRVLYDAFRDLAASTTNRPVLTRILRRRLSKRQQRGTLRM